MADTFSNLGQKADDLKDKAKDTASGLASQAKDAAHTARERTDDALSAVGDRLSNLAGRIRESAPGEGVLGNAAGAVADRLQTGGRYLSQHGVQDMTKDLGGLVRQYPVQALLLGVGVGYLIGMASGRRA